jgi:hypothetical protein
MGGYVQWMTLQLIFVRALSSVPKMPIKSITGLPRERERKSEREPVSNNLLHAIPWQCMFALSILYFEFSPKSKDVI